MVEVLLAGGWWKRVDWLLWEARSVGDKSAKLPRRPDRWVKKQQKGHSVKNLHCHRKTFNSLPLRIFQTIEIKPHKRRISRSHLPQPARKPAIYPRSNHQHLRFQQKSELDPEAARACLEATVECWRATSDRVD